MVALPRVRNNLDLAWKEALTAWLPDFLALFLPQAHEAIDWSQPIEFLESEVRRLGRGLKGQGRRADVVAKVHLRSGGPTLLVIHVEVQSQKDGTIALRMRLYYHRLFDRHQCPILSILVLGDPSPEWRPSQHESEFAGCYSVVRFPVIKLWDWRDRLAELEALRNPFALVVAAHLAVLETRPDQPARVQRALRLCRLMAGHGYSRDEVYRLFDILDSMMAMTDELHEVFEGEVARLEEDLEMALISPTAVRRFKKGLQEGRVEGFQEGRVDDRRASILEFCQARFGTAPEGLEAALEALSDLATLKRLTRLAATVATAEELLEAARTEAKG